MALAKSSNIHEAESAMSKAHELIDKFNIDLLNTNSKRDYFTLFIGEPKLRHFREAYFLSNLLIDFYFVEGIWVSAFVVDKEKMGRVLEISGTAQNIKIADYVYNYISKFIDNQWIEFKKTKKISRYRKTDFAIGIIEGFRLKLERSRKKTIKYSSEKSLVIQEDKQLKTYFQKRYPRINFINKKKITYDKEILDEGLKLGEKLVISKGISEKTKVLNKFLE